MGLLNRILIREKEKTPLQILNELSERIQATAAQSPADSDAGRFLTYLTEAKKNPEALVIQPLELFIETVTTITSNDMNYNINTYLSGAKQAEEIYPKLFPYGMNTPDFGLLATIFLNLFQKNGPAANGLFNSTLLSTFQKKHNYMDYISSVTNVEKYMDCLNDIVHYGLRVRAFFLEDDAYTSHMKHVTQIVLNTGDRTSIFKEEAKKVERMAGIYDIDEVDVAKAEQQLIKTTALLKEAEGILTQANRKTEQLHRVMKDTTDTIQEISKREINLLSMKADNAKDDLHAAYNSFLEEQKQEVNLRKDILLGQIFEEAEEKLNDLRAMANAITVSANTELLKINTETSHAMSKINDFVHNDGELRKILAKASENNELYDKISKLELLSTQNIETITRQMMPSATPENIPTVIHVQNTSPAVVSGEIAAPVQLPSSEALPTKIPTVSPFLDTSIPFRNRYERVMEEKRRRMAKGEHFHVMFDDVITVLMEDANPYLIGPSGCGKTFMVKQIASILQLDFIDIGYINEEYDILGFQTATGAYSAPNFYRCYKYGKIAFCDELDNGNSRATVKLNSFLSNGKDACYSFPHGEIVPRHKNFRIIAAGNTAGNGADANYNTREKIEESVQQRFTPIYINYDNAVEQKILQQYTDWYQFVVIFRKATDAWSNRNECSAPGILTTRDAARIKKYLDNKSLNMDQILDYEFIQTKDMEYLAFLANHMKTNIHVYPDAREICTRFQAKVNVLRERGRY